MDMYDGLAGQDIDRLTNKALAERIKQPNHALVVSGKVAYALGGLLCLWLFVYISGVFPYLGWGRADNYSSTGTQTDIGSMSLGVSSMFLFEGQTAFIDYEMETPDSAITLDVKPILTIGYSDNVYRLKGVESGRAEFLIEKSGLYTFEHEPALGRPYGHTKYSVSWGAI
jgi:hypothetical protein